MKSFLLSLLFLIYNLSLAGAILALSWIDLSLVAYLLILLSKWRIFAVSQHYWIPHLKSNSCDLVVGISTVALINTPYFSTNLTASAFIALLYVGWLIVIKPLSHDWGRSTQALICQFYGLSALWLHLDGALSGLVAIPLAWLVGLIAANHFLNATQTEDSLLRSTLVMIWGLFIACLAWLSWVWSISYVLPSGVFAIPQIAIIATLSGYFTGQIINGLLKKDLTRQNVLQNTIFFIGIMAIIIVFSPWQPVQ